MKEKIYHGIGVSEGIRVGKALVYGSRVLPHADRTITAEEVPAELERLQNAVEQAKKEVDRLIVCASSQLKGTEAEVIRGQKTFLSDPAFCPAMKKLVKEKQYAPEKAVRAVTEQYASLFANMDNAYMRERAADVRDAGRRLLRYLTGSETVHLKHLTEPVILVADDLSPSDTIQFDRSCILAFATQKGGKTSHTSIFAKSLGIPAIVGIPNLLEQIKTEDTVILDGQQGTFTLSPTPQTTEVYSARIKREEERKERYMQASRQNAHTLDGKRIVAAANIGSAADAQNSLAMGAEGAGLFRTEQMYLSRSSAPTEEEQFAVYKKVAKIYGHRRVIVRTLDIGGDKEVDYLGIAKESNPFLGCRAIRYCLRNEHVFLTQLRAILRASVYGSIAVMFPMISGLQELRRAKDMLQKAKEQLKALHLPFDESIPVGIMVEVPAAAIMSDILAKEVDFFSIGTNDLVQYTLAVDRGNETISYLYDYFDPAVIRLIQHTSQAAHTAGIPLGMCGAMAGDPLAVPLLVGLGLNELSMPAGSLPQVKYLMGRLSAGSCRRLTEQVMSCRTAQQVRLVLQDYQNKNKE